MRGARRGSLWIATGVAVAGCGPVDAPDEIRSPQAESSLPLEEISDRAGLRFFHYPGATGDYQFIESTGSGVALLDYDLDGDLDVYLIQSGPIPDRAEGEPLMPLPAHYRDSNRLFENRLVPDGTLEFIDVTDRAGVGDSGYGQGVAAGDVDNDGDPDLYVTNFGGNVFFRNDGDGRFTDVIEDSGADDPRWNTSAAFVDFDRDGDLDLFVASYVVFTVNGNKTCFKNDGRRDYCGPDSFAPTVDRLFRNDGDWRFVDVTRDSGIGLAQGKGLGVVGDDFDADGNPDLYVANDGWPNHLWLGDGQGRFRETGVMSGSAYNAAGKPEASMGVTAGDYDGDGDPDLFMTHLGSETNTLYRNDGGGQFMDVTGQAGLGAPSRPFTGFGSAWFDLENDGDLDLFIANGAVALDRGRTDDSAFPYAQPNQLFRNEGGVRFSEISTQGGAPLMPEEVSRGAAFGDLDNDGDTDIVVTNAYGAARLLLNRAADGVSSLVVTVRGTRSVRDGTGARVHLILADGQILRRRAGTDGSYLSAGDPRLVFGLGGEARPVAVEVGWPAGQRERFSLEADQTTAVLVEGEGLPLSD